MQDFQALLPKSLQFHHDLLQKLGLDMENFNRYFESVKFCKFTPEQRLCQVTLASAGPEADWETRSQRRRLEIGALPSKFSDLIRTGGVPG